MLPPTLFFSAAGRRIVGDARFSCKLGFWYITDLGPCTHPPSNFFKLIALTFIGRAIAFGRLPHACTNIRMASWKFGRGGWHAGWLRLGACARLFLACINIRRQGEAFVLRRCVLHSKLSHSREARDLDVVSESVTTISSPPTSPSKRWRREAEEGGFWGPDVVQLGVRSS